MYTMMQKWIIVGMFLLNVSMRVVEADIECHYCGMRDTCTLPYIQTSASKISCQDSCMKFDGKDPNGKRVVVRSCGKKNLTKCEMEQKWNKGIGELCFCNTMNCNNATKLSDTNSTFCIALYFVYQVFLKYH